MSFWYFPVAERRKKKGKKNGAEIGNGLLPIEHEAGRWAGRGSRMGAGLGVLGAGRAQAGMAGVRGRWAWRAGRRAWAGGQATAARGRSGLVGVRGRRGAGRWAWARGALGLGVRGAGRGRAGHWAWARGARGARPGLVLGAWAGRGCALGALGHF